MDHSLKTAVSSLGFCLFLFLGLSSAFALNSRSSRDATEPIRPGSNVDTRNANLSGNRSLNNNESQDRDQRTQTQKIYNQQQRGGAGQDSRGSSDTSQRRGPSSENARAVNTTTGAGADNARKINRK